MANLEAGQLTISRMLPADVDAVLWVEQSSFRDPWSRKLFEEEFKNPDLSQYFTAKVDDHIVGYMGFWLVEDEAHITNLAIHPAFRRQGIAQKLLQNTMARAKKMGAERATLEVRASNEPAKKMYEKNGFNLVAIRKKYYSDNQEDALILWMDDLSGFELDNQKNNRQ